MALTEQEISQIESEVWNGYGENPLPSLESIQAAQSASDNIYHQKPLSYIFAMSASEGLNGCILPEHFTEMGYILEDGKCTFPDGSYVLYNEANGCLRVFEKV